MRLPILLLAVGFAVHAADERQLALALQAHADFDRVYAAAMPALPDTVACIQSQAALLPVSAPEERRLILFRKGYCALAGAVIAQDPAQYNAAAVSLGQAIEAWPARVAAAAKQKLPAPEVPSALRVFHAISRMKQDPARMPLEAEESQLAAAVDHPACDSSFMPPDSCQAALQLGNVWLGWIAFRRGDSIAAARRFSGTPLSGWPQWVEGQQAFRAGDYQQAAARYGEAVEIWRRADPAQPRPLLQQLNPLPDLAPVMTELGEAQLLGGNPRAAIATLNAAVKADSSKARAIYLRARAKAAAGQSEAALDDYNLASRTAFAAAAGRSSGEAHLYRGILLYRSKDWARAEDEFTDALNFDVPAAMKSDAAAWRHLAAVAGGSCGASRQYLERSLATVTPDFPKDDAQSALAACAAAAPAASLRGSNAFK